MCEKWQFGWNAGFQPVDKVLILPWTKGIARGFEWRYWCCIICWCSMYQDPMESKEF
jgi:hypothetical protein